MSENDTITGPSGDPADPMSTPERAGVADWIGFFSFMIVRSLMRALPFTWASGLASGLWRLMAPFNGRHPRSLKHLAIAYPEKTENERRAIALAMWGHLGRTMAESFLIDRIANTPDLFEFNIAPDVQKLIDQKQAMVITTLHIGNWELPAVATRSFGIEIAGVYRRINNPLINDAIRKNRAPFYPLGILMKGQNAGKELIKLIKQGKSVGIVADLRDKRGISVPFFGHAAQSTPFPAMLSTLDGTPLVAVQCVRLRPDKLRVDMTRISAPEGADRDETIYNLTAALQAQFEIWIRQNPEQWMWAHRRWD